MKYNQEQIITLEQEFYSPRNAVDLLNIYKQNIDKLSAQTKQLSLQIIKSKIINNLKFKDIKYNSSNQILSINNIEYHFCDCALYWIDVYNTIKINQDKRGIPILCIKYLGYDNYTVYFYKHNILLINDNMKLCFGIKTFKNNRISGNAEIGNLRINIGNYQQNILLTNIDKYNYYEYAIIKENEQQSIDIDFYYEAYRKANIHIINPLIL